VGCKVLWSACLCVCLCVCLPVCLYAYMSQKPPVVMYCDQRVCVCLFVCLSVCPLTYLKTPCPHFTKLSVCVTCARGSVFFSQQAQYGLRAVMCPGSFVDFDAIYIVYLFVYLTSFLTFSLLYILASFYFFITYFLLYAFTSWLSYSFQNTFVPFLGRRS